MSNTLHGVAPAISRESWYRARVAPDVSVALALLALWDRPWSSNAIRFAYHALHRAYARGLDVLEASPRERWSEATER